MKLLPKSRDLHWLFSRPKQGIYVPCRGLPTDRYMWSDATGLQECTKASTKPPSLQWTWVSSGLGVGQRLQ